VNAAVGCIVSFLGGIVGAAAGVGVTYLILAGQRADALEWAVSFAMFAIIGMVLGAGVAIGLALLVRKRFVKVS
jgi:ABC-type antimicrobial peptide transport system permease subunit